MTDTTYGFRGGTVCVGPAHFFWVNGRPSYVKRRRAGLVYDEAHPRPLKVNGHEYTRRRRNR